MAPTPSIVCLRRVTVSSHTAQSHAGGSRSAPSGKASGHARLRETLTTHATMRRMARPARVTGASGIPSRMAGV